MRRALIAATAILICLGAGSLSRADPERFWFGGGVGLSFGDVDTVDISPVVGFSLNERVSAGVGLSYRYRDDDRYPGGLSTNDYGANLFARFDVTGQAFVHAEYEYLSYEYVRSDLTTERDEFASLLAGPGFFSPLGERTGLYVLALYNFSYDSGDLSSPYDDAWSFRVGVSVGF